METNNSCYYCKHWIPSEEDVYTLEVFCSKSSSYILDPFGNKLCFERKELDVVEDLQQEPTKAT